MKTNILKKNSIIYGLKAENESYYLIGPVKVLGVYGVKDELGILEVIPLGSPFSLELESFNWTEINGEKHYFILLSEDIEWKKLKGYKQLQEKKNIVDPFDPKFLQEDEEPKLKEKSKPKTKVPPTPENKPEMPSGLPFKGKGRFGGMVG